jgi:signal transduction histidine kinase
MTPKPETPPPVRVLNVDDNEATRYALTRVLRQAGFEVGEAGTGEEALRRAGEGFDIVLLDIHLPDIDGRELCRRLKADAATASIPVLQLTATYNSSENWAESLDGGADGYLSQPVDPPVLIATVRALWRARAAERALREANRLKDEFLATLSHELRTPLNAIVGWATVLRSPALDAATSSRAVSAILRNAEAQTRLISDILDVSRIVAGKLRLNTGRIEMATVVASAVDTVRAAADAKQIRLQMALGDDTEVQGDADRLQQVAWNLLTNAVKFTPRGGTVSVDLARTASLVTLTVSDTGMGIDRAFLPFVFDRFRQADASASRTTSGLGLGLALVKHLTEAHGGTVAAASAGEGKGSTFTVTVPAAVWALTAEAAPGGSETPSAAILQGLRVLVVDDDPDALEHLRFLLKGAAAEVTCVRSAAEALEALAAGVPDVLVSDIGMPHVDGYDLIREIRSQARERAGGVPALALTAYASSHDRTRALDAGYQAHLAKPADRATLTRTIRDLVDRWRE